MALASAHKSDVATLILERHIWKREGRVHAPHDGVARYVSGIELSGVANCLIKCLFPAQDIQQIGAGTFLIVLKHRQ